MKNKPFIAVLLVCVAFLFLPVIVSAAPAASPEWTLQIEGVDGVTQVKSSDLAELEAVSATANTVNSSGTASTRVYGGYKVSDILEYLGVTEFTSIKTTASDDYSTNYDKELVLKEDTLIAWERDG